MDGQDFIRVVEVAFLPFLKALGFHMDAPSINGKFYRISFSGPKNVILISYEPGDNAQFIMVFGREGGGLSNIDDRFKTPRLTDLNDRYMHAITDGERARNDEEFSSVHVVDKEERFLLKSAKELRLVLPRYLND